MWDIYGKAGFTIRFEREYFQSLIKKSKDFQEEPTTLIDLLVAGKVAYQNFDNMVSIEEESLLKFSVFRKHLSFNHENEYRIVGFTNEILDIPGLRFKLPELDDLEFDIIANPRLNPFQFDKYKSILEKYSTKHILKESALKIWLEFRKTEFEK